MKGTRTLWTIGAVALSAAVGLGFSASANAIKIDDKYSVTYAKETFLKAEGTAAGERRTVTGVGTFYNLAPEHMIAGPADIIANNDGAMYEVLFTLQNMVFHDAQLGTDALTRTAPPTTNTPNPAADTGWFAVSRGGAPGDNFVMFTQNATDNDIGAKDMLTLTANFAVTADGPGGITRTVTNKALSAGTGLPVTMTHVNADAVKVVRALKVTAAPPATLPQADASDDFMSFTGASTTRILRAPLGTLTVDVESGIRDARVVEDTTDDDGVDTTMVTLAGPKDATGADLTPHNGNLGIVAAGTLTSASTAAGSAVTFSGDYSFLKTLALSDNADCSGTLTELRKPSEDDRTILTDMTMPMAAGEFIGGMTLCVVVDGDTAIPDTEAYMATTEFKGPADNMFPPMGGMHTLTAISRGGTTVHIPFLTVSDKFKQRLNIVNRGSPTTYALGSLHTPGMSVMAKDAASGTVPMGHTTLMVADMIEVEGASRASGTLSLPASKNSITASLDIVNPETGAIDTTILMAE